MTLPCVVIGAGGHAKVVISALRSTSRRVMAVYDDDQNCWGTTLLQAPVSGPVDQALHVPPGTTEAILAIGSNAVRSQLARRLQGLTWATVVHARAWIDDSARIDAGTVVMAGAIVQPATHVGAHVIINTGASVDHDCVIGAYCHIGPGAAIAGQVELGEGVFVGAGASIIPGVRIGAWATVGAGAAVISDVPAHATVTGVPARQLQARQ